MLGWPAPLHRRHSTYAFLGAFTLVVLLLQVPPMMADLAKSMTSQLAAGFGVNLNQGPAGNANCT